MKSTFMTQVKKGLKNNSKKVYQYSLEGEFIKEWDCIMDVKRELGILNQGVILCCQGKRKKAGGFIWKYNK